MRQTRKSPKSVPGVKAWGPSVEVGEADGCVVGDAEAVVARRRVVAGMRWLRAAAAVVEGLVVGLGGGVFVGGVRDEGEVAAGAGAGIDEAGGEELLEGGAVEGEAVGLREMGGCQVRPSQSEVFEHGGGRIRGGSAGGRGLRCAGEGAVGVAGALVRR